MEKAVKVVYGHCSEDLAERELKSLERIRSVRHPFVISLERFEIVGGRLIIVTELADMSLDACFRKYHEAGETGIPRDELLAYLRDAADALDCLVERHSLQHLDIKPENLLVVGDHVKVGDFGLVKELATRTLNSMMGGMTPLYSAPEVFDDDPSPRSDQYSLAIVYQQMLTGQLPFPGRTPAQLAKQHTQAEPNLQSLSESDRKVMRRVLAKKPEQRFASCREFIATLTSGGVRPAPQAAAPATATSRSSVSTPAEDDTKSIAAIQTQPVGRPPASAAAPAATNPRVRCEQSEPAKAPAVALAYPEVNDQIFDVPPPTFHSAGAQTAATLFVAAGGLGLTLLRATRRRIGRTDPGELSRGNLAWIAIDTDRETLNEATGEETACRLPGTDTLHIPLKRPKQYRDGSQALLRWVSRRWLYNIPRSLETRGYRPLGRIAAVDHAESILGSLYTRLHQLVHSNSSAAPLRVVLLAGTSGGTGSGVVVDLAQAVRSLATDLGVEVQVHAVLAMPERVAGSTESLSIANTYSLLTELTHVEREGNRGTSSPTGPAERYEADGPAFDAVYLVPIPPRTFGDGRVQTFVSIAEYLALEATTAEVAVHLVHTAKPIVRTTSACDRSDVRPCRTAPGKMPCPRRWNSTSWDLATAG